MPKDSCWILIGANEGSDIDGIILNHGPTSVVPLRSKQLAQLSKSCEAPVVLLLIKPVICGCPNISCSWFYEGWFDVILCVTNIVGSFLFQRTSVNCTHADQSSDGRSCVSDSGSPFPCSRYKDAKSGLLLPVGKSRILLADYQPNDPEPDSNCCQGVLPRMTTTLEDRAPFLLPQLGVALNVPGRHSLICGFEIRKLREVLFFHGIILWTISSCLSYLYGLAGAYDP